ncbi:hypothetical protein EXN66_Car013684 [Channa argus]|uniref:Uncharacterized protein n=1 Tax=Channa argus TaxID=215402 RepID=A0A6G1Q6M1_CHAAH|nr:hypothetical protein EXN66_Car013684 [Channa argus]
MRTEWQLTAGPSCLSLPSVSPSLSFTHTHMSSGEDVHPTQVVPMGSSWSAAQHKMHWQRGLGAVMHECCINVAQLEQMITICLQQLFFSSARK